MCFHSQRGPGCSKTRAAAWRKSAVDGGGRGAWAGPSREDAERVAHGAL